MQDIPLDGAEVKDSTSLHDHRVISEDMKDQDTTGDKATSHIKQDSVDSYTSSSSSSSVQYAEADSGDHTIEMPDEAPSHSRTPSLDNKFSSISLDSTAPTSKSTSMTLDTSADAQKRDSMASNATASSVDKAGADGRDKPESPSEASSTKRVSLAHPETPSSPTNHASLLTKQLDAHAEDGHQNDNDRWRDSRVEGTTASAMDSVALSDSRPTSEVFSPLANDFSSSFQEVEIPSGTTPPIASTSSALPLDTSANGKHLSTSASNNMQRSPTRQSTASSTHNYDLIQQRAETHHADLEDHPKRHRRTLRGSQDLRANFEKLREEMASPSPPSPVNSSPPKGAPHEAPQIDWDFWGEVMSDYEGIAKTRRECFLQEPFSLLSCR